MLEQLTAIASVISALAIVATAVYASIQIRHNTRAVTAASFQHVVNSFAEYSFEIGHDRELVDLCFRANRDYASLNEVERYQFSLLLLSFLRRAENVLFQSTAHVLSEAHWAGMRRSISTNLAPPGAQACWVELKDRMNPEFQAFVTSLIAE
jgi:hypothetical protein